VKSPELPGDWRIWDLSGLVGVHFGLGEHKWADKVEVRFPDGTVVASDELIKEGVNPTLLEDSRLIQYGDDNYRRLVNTEVLSKP